MKKLNSLTIYFISINLMILWVIFWIIYNVNGNSIYNFISIGCFIIANVGIWISDLRYIDEKYGNKNGKV